MEFVKISSKAFTALVANKIELQYLPSLSINYVAISKDLKKLPPQVCWIKMKRVMIRVAMTSELS